MKVNYLFFFMQLNQNLTVKYKKYGTKLHDIMANQKVYNVIINYKAVAD